MKVTTDQTCDFAEQWRYTAPGTTAGLWIAMEPHHIQFATDWANICLVSFMELILAKQEKKKAAAAAETGPAQVPPSKIVLTGADS